MRCGAPSSEATLRRQALLSIAMLWAGTWGVGVAAHQIDIAAPEESARFGLRVHVLPHGNLVVFDCVNDDQATGSVSLYRPDGSRISTLHGGMTGDCVGGGGLMEVGEGNFIVLSPNWTNDGAEHAGAVTWIDGRSGLNGIVSATNSLVGSSPFDRVGQGQGIVLLGNRNYIVQSVSWDNAAVPDAGAVVWADGNSGIVGTISADNALIGTRAWDGVGSAGGWGHAITELADGDFLVASPHLDWDGFDDVGAVTWGSGTSGIQGEVAATNSFIGRRSGDRVGEANTIALSSGGYIVCSPYVDAIDVIDAGALSWSDGPGALIGRLDASNSLFGLFQDDQLGWALIEESATGNIAVGLPSFGQDDVGAVVLIPSDARPTGLFDPATALVGSQPGDRIGSQVVALTNGHFIVASRTWRNGSASNAGAVTWVDGSTGLAGTVGPDNSMVGSQPGDSIAETLLPLPDGRYVVVSPYWSSPNVPRVGAVSVGDGHGGPVGPLSTDNSLVGSRASDLVGYGGVTVLTNGNLVVLSPRWARDENFIAGAATWMDSNLPALGPVGPANSLVGSSIEDGRGMRVFALKNGNFVVGAPAWDHAGVADAGAVVWGDGTLGLAGPIFAATALVGSSSGDFPIDNFNGSRVVWPLANGNYVVNARNWDGTLPDMGAAAWGDGRRGTRGLFSPQEALIGSAIGDMLGDVTVYGDNVVISVPGFDANGISNGGAVALVRGTGAFSGTFSQDFTVFGESSATGYWDQVKHAYDPVRDVLIVGRPSDRMVSLLKIDALLRHGFD